MGLHLLISQDVLDGIDVNERDDKPYQMLLRWIRATDSSTPYRDLYYALCKEKVGLDNVAREFCFKETTGTGTYMHILTVPLLGLGHSEDN